MILLIKITIGYLVVAALMYAVWRLVLRIGEK